MRHKIFLALIVSLSFIFCGIAPLCTDAFAEISQDTAAKKKKTVKKKKTIKKKAANGQTTTSDSKGYAPVRKKPEIKGTSVKKKTAEEDAIVTSFGGKTRIDFADLLIEGQTKKADTVYLFERTESKIDSLVKIRKDFRKEIMDSYLE